MIAFLTMWPYSASGSRTEKIECKELIIKDGPSVDIDGDPATLFHVIVADGIYHNVATVEVV